MKSFGRVLFVLLPFLPAFMFTLCFAITAPVRAIPIYSQVLPLEPTGAYGSQNTDNRQKIADSFLILGAEPVRVRSIRFIGGYGLTNPPPITPPLNALPTDDFGVAFLEDVNGSPGMPISGGEFEIGPASRRTPTEGALLNGAYFPIEFVINLDEGISLSPATVYWISITNDAGADYGWLWARAFGQFDLLTAATFGNLLSGPWTVYESGGMFFELSNQAVPEPSMSAMLVAVITRVLLKRQARHKRVASSVYK